MLPSNYKQSSADEGFSTRAFLHSTLLRAALKIKPFVVKAIPLLCGLIMHAVYFRVIRYFCSMLSCRKRLIQSHQVFTLIPDRYDMTGISCYIYSYLLLHFPILAER